MILEISRDINDLLVKNKFSYKTFVVTVGRSSKPYTVMSCVIYYLDSFDYTVHIQQLMKLSSWCHQLCLCIIFRNDITVQ